MAAAADVIGAKYYAPPAEWALLPPYDGERGALWQVWTRDKGAAYWLMKFALRVVNRVGKAEARLRGRRWEEITNPHALEDGGTYPERAQAEDYCRIAWAAGKAATICPVVVGRAYPVERVRATGDFDPFRVFDFSATEAVKEQARHKLVSVDEWDELTSLLTGIRETAMPRS